MTAIEQPTAGAAYDLTEEQMRFFDENNYLVLHDHIPADLLARLREVGQQWIRDGKGPSREAPRYFEYNFAKRPWGRGIATGWIGACAWFRPH